MASEFSNEEIDRIVKEELSINICQDFRTYGEDGTFLPKYFEDWQEPIEHLEIRNSDIFVASFPKCGTTWLQEMVWLISNDLDYEGAKVSLGIRFPFLEPSGLYDLIELENQNGLHLYSQDSVGFVAQLKSPRFIKSHLHYSLLPAQIRKRQKSPKIFYISRNPKDACVSYYHFTKILPLGTPATLQNYAKIFLADKVLYAPYWKHVLGYWEHRNDPNLFVTTYEELHKDLKGVIGKIATFLCKELNGDQVEKLSKHLSFESMKDNRAVNYEERREERREVGIVKEDGHFMRSGTVGKYREELSPEMIKRFDEWTKKNIEGTTFGEQYNYDL